MICSNCGFENEDDAPYCKQCGVNLNNDDVKNFKDNVEVLNETFKVDKKRRFIPSEESFQTKLLYKHDRYTGELRFAKTKSISLVVFFAFMGIGLIASISLAYSIPVAIITAILFGAIFAIPVAIIGFILGRVIDKIFH